MTVNEVIVGKLGSIVGPENVSTKEADRIAYGRDSFPLKIMQ